MQKISFKVNSSKLYFYEKSFNTNKDFLIKTNCNSHEYDFLIFLDSRGFSFETKKNLASFFLKKIKKQKILIIIRPLLMTTWGTLNNFLYLNPKIKFKFLITNMGFNDFTPKKKILAKNVLKQSNYLFKNKQLKIKFIEKFTDEKNKEINLYNVNFNKKYLIHLNKQLPNKKLILINTPPLKKNSFFKKRLRPKSFFSMINRSINFNKKIKTLKIINFTSFNEKNTYDGVHYTDNGYKQIFKKLNKIKIY